MNAEKRQRLIDRLLPLYEQGFNRTAITLEEFFSGNCDEGSLAGGNPDYPILEKSREILGTIETNPHVESIFLEVNEVPDDEDDDEVEMWVTVIRALLITTAPVEDVWRWLEPLKPRDVWESQMILENDLLREIHETEPPSNYETRIRLPYNLNKQENVRVVWIDLRNLYDQRRKTS